MGDDVTDYEPGKDPPQNKNYMTSQGGKNQGNSYDPDGAGLRGGGSRDNPDTFERGNKYKHSQLSSLGLQAEVKRSGSD